MVSALNHLLVMLLSVSVIVLLSACGTNERSMNDRDFVLNIYTGESEIGSKSIAFDELVANENRPILLNFWANNCPPCRAEMIWLEAAWQEYGDKVLFVGVDVGPYVGLGTYNGGRDLVEDFSITYVTGNTYNKSVITDWQVTNMPSTFLLNRDGQVHDLIVGAIPSSRLSRKIQELIAANSDQ
jgi:thiol-disulfide isomerase/thioredoxin